MSHQSQYSVNKLYQSVIDDVVQCTREAFLDEGIDEQVQQELRMLWEAKLVATRAVEPETQGSSTGPSAAANGKSKNSRESNSQNNQQSNSSAQQQQQQQPPQPHVVSADPTASVPIQITMPRGPTDPAGFQRTIQIHVPAACIHSNKLQDILSLPTIQATLSLPSELAASTLQGQVNQALLSAGIPVKHGGKGSAAVISSNSIPQIDGGGGDTSSEDDDDEDEENDEEENDDNDDDEEVAEEEEAQDEEPLNSGDDVSEPEDDNDKLYEIDNVVVCQYDKITRTRNKWKFHLKDGIMNLNGRDYVFQKANGDAEW